MSFILENLREAIIGESNAKRKYELYAEKAREENVFTKSHTYRP